MIDFARKLKLEIKKGLPGTETQWQMASTGRLIKYPRDPGPDARPASVLILFYPYNDSIHTVFMQRPDYVGIHGGQISFPGGKQEPGDADEIATALRECYEEIGINPSKVSIIGTLTPLFIPVSNMIVTPVAGWMNEKPVFDCKSDEVVFLIYADLRIFLDPSIVKSKPLTVMDEVLDVKYFDYKSNTIWGATAMIFNELLAILRRGSFFAEE